jgi:hypothetical protein
MLVNPELQNYIRQARQAGKSDEIIRAELKTGGWTDLDISQALSGQIPINSNNTLQSGEIANNYRKYKYTITGALLSVFAILNIVGIVLSAFHSQNYCSIGFHNDSLFIGDFLRFIAPVIYSYIGFVYLFLGKHPEKENLLSKISFWLVILTIIGTFGGYVVPFLGYFLSIIVYMDYGVYILISLPVLAFILLLIGNFKIKYLLISLITLAIFAGAYFLERNRGCQDDYSLSNKTTSLNSAIEKDTEEACKSLSSTVSQNTCYDKLAENKNDPLICRLVVNTPDSAATSEMQEGCYSWLARKNLDPTICASIENPDLKHGCIFEATPISMEKCNMIDDTLQKEGCIRDVAFEKKDVKICDLITGKQHDYCIENYATLTKNCELVKFDSNPDPKYPGLYELCLINTGQASQ